MSEAAHDQANAPQEPEAEAAPTVVPEEVDAEIFQQMYADNYGTPLDESEGAASPPDASGEVPGEENAELKAQIDHLTQQLHMQQQHLNTVAQQQNTNGQGEQANPTIEDVVRDKNPDLNADQVNWLVEQVQTIAGPALQTAFGRIEQLEGRAKRDDQQLQVSQFDNHVNQLMDKANVSDPWERKVIRHAIVNEGLERHGSNFDLAKATQVFHGLNNERVDQRQNQSQQYIDTKNQNIQQAPPVSGPTSGKTGVEDIRREVRDPGNRKMDFSGDGMTDLVSGFLDSIEKKTDNSLGARTG
jgi:hypothetical protein